MPKPPPHGARADDLRAAFDRLTTPDKAAFVLEAAFGTIGQAITETGRAVADAVSSLDLDGLFRDPTRPADPTPDPAAAAAAAAAATGEAPRKRPGRPRRDPGVPPGPDAPSAT